DRDDAVERPELGQAPGQRLGMPMQFFPAHREVLLERGYWGQGDAAPAQVVAPRLIAEACPARYRRGSRGRSDLLIAAGPQMAAVDLPASVRLDLHGEVGDDRQALRPDHEDRLDP